MKYYDDFRPTGQSFAERVGLPDEQHAAMGRIALGFSFLEDTARNMIVLLASLAPEAGSILTAGMSFRQKMDVLSSLTLHRFASDPPPDGDLEEQVKDIFVLCAKVEDLRNAYMHSSYAGAARARISARRRQGLKLTVEPVDSGLLLDVADFIVCAAMELEGLPMLLDIADRSSGGADYVSYTKNGVEVATFKFGEVMAQPGTLGRFARCEIRFLKE